ncbi:MAG: hypothetical protein HZC03_01490, partial [Candidatus Lloydbacteria bacterium]|nr:hypothetical protein [Candidatus Lloydbacteria bacterium]
MFTNTKTRNRAFIAGAGALGLLSLYGFLLFLMIRNIDKAVLASGEIANESHKEENIRLLKKSIDNTGEERANIAARFVSEDGIVPFIERVESLGELSHAQVTLRSVSVEGEKNDMLKLELSIVGSFSEVFHFLTLAEHLPFKVSFEKTSMLKLPQERGQNKWEAVVTLDLLSFGGRASADNKKTP